MKTMLLDPSYGGWCESDVMAYLSRFGEVSRSADDQDLFRVDCGVLFRAHVEWSRRASQWEGGLWWRGGHDFRAGTSSDLGECFQQVVERWRKLVAESDPILGGTPPGEGGDKQEVDCCPEWIE